MSRLQPPASTPPGPSKELPKKRVPATLRFQVASNIHLEHDGSYDTFDIEKNPDVDYLLLPGDTGSAIRLKGDRYAKDSHANGYLNFLVRLCQKFKKVFLIAGNNESRAPFVNAHTSP